MEAQQQAKRQSLGHDTGPVGQELESPLNTSMSPRSNSTLPSIADEMRSAMLRLEGVVWRAVVTTGKWGMGLGQGGPLQDFLNGWNNTHYANKGKDKNADPETNKKVKEKDTAPDAQRETKREATAEPAQGASRDRSTREDDIVLSRRRAA